MPECQGTLLLLSDCNATQTHNYLVCKRTLNHLAKLAKWLSVHLQTKWLWVRVLLQSHKHVTEIETHLNNDFSNLCEWFLDNKLSIHFGEDKTKSILLGAKCKLRKVGKLSITYQGIDINQNSNLLILVVDLMKQCLVNQWLTNYKEINSRLNYDTKSQAALIQCIDSDYACTEWYPNLNKKLKNKIQST